MQSLQWFGCFNVSKWKETDTEWQKLLELCQEEERKRIVKFYHKIDAKRSLAGHLLIRQKLAKILNRELNEIILKRNKENKPYLYNPNLENLNFNIGHSGDWVVLGIETNYLIGVDVEKITKRNSKSLDDFFKYLKQCFTKKEWNTILQTNSKLDLLDEKSQFLILERFFVHWTLKESFIKAIGQGLGFDLQRCEFRFFNERGEEILQSNLFSVEPKMFIDGKCCQKWKFKVTKLDENHVVSIALGPFDDPNVTQSFKEVLHLGKMNNDIPKIENDFEILEMIKIE